LKWLLRTTEIIGHSRPMHCPTTSSKGKYAKSTT
jgi:hypothetical protein